MVRAIVGANWGDEGKGKITDMLAKESDIIIRFQGGSNAGHTIINDYGKICTSSSSVWRILSAYYQHHWKWCCIKHPISDQGDPVYRRQRRSEATYPGF